MRPGAKQSIRTKFSFRGLCVGPTGPLFFGTIVGADTAGQLRENAFSMLADKVSSRAAVLENEMTQRWGKAENYQRVMQLRWRHTSRRRAAKCKLPARWQKS